MWLSWSEVELTLVAWQSLFDSGCLAWPWDFLFFRDLVLDFAAKLPIPWLIRYRGVGCS